MEDCEYIERAAKDSRQRVVLELTNSYLKNNFVTKCYNGSRTWKNPLDKRTELRKMDMRFGIWNVRRLHMAGSLMTVAKVISNYKLHVVGVQNIKLDRDGNKPTGKYLFLYGKENENHELGTGFFCT
jgi:hypothetical protein